MMRQMAALSRISILMLLCFAALFELILHRTGIPLVGRRMSDSWVWLTMERSGTFFFYLSGILALAAFSWTMARLLWQTKDIGLFTRFFLTIGVAIFLPLAAVDLIGLPPSLAPYLNLSFGFVVLGILLLALRQDLDLRNKLGLFYMSIPLLLHCYWLFSRQMPQLAPQGAYGDLPNRLFETGEQMAVVGAFAAFLFFAPFPRWTNFKRVLPLSIAIFFTGLLATLMWANYPVAAQIVYYGFRLNLPPPGFQGAFYLLATFFFTITVAILLHRGGFSRGIAIGLFFIGLSGFQLEHAQRLLLSLTGLAAIVFISINQRREQLEKAGAAKHAPIDESAWRVFAGRLLECSEDVATEKNVVVIRERETIICRITGFQQQLPYALRILYRPGMVSELEVSVGHPPSQDPPAMLTRRDASKGHRLRGGRGTKVTLDGPFELRVLSGNDRNRFLELAESPQLRSRLETTIHGQLGLWPGEGVLYRAQPLDDGWPIPLAELAFDATDASPEELFSLLSCCASVASELKAS
jgi:hypothetical protein